MIYDKGIYPLENLGPLGSVLLVIVLFGRSALLFEKFEPFFDFLSELLVSSGVGEVERLLGK